MNFVLNTWTRENHFKSNLNQNSNTIKIIMQIKIKLWKSIFKIPIECDVCDSSLYQSKHDKWDWVKDFLQEIIRHHQRSSSFHSIFNTLATITLILHHLIYSFMSSRTWPPPLQIYNTRCHTPFWQQYWNRMTDAPSETNT